MQVHEGPELRSYIFTQSADVQALLQVYNSQSSKGKCICISGTHTDMHAPIIHLHKNIHTLTSYSAAS